ncbi:hypothetical protein FUAX_46690 (plasmid) [Fulvitalea axinellae]|uniref:exo-alpha-sialidase n=1 Tax=Fulvitalea axinellae TaxID=1182444 RepID=A0AAU9CWF5_9BACT|nr:hypothetical protein FUAX_46690 [Fulvitalea axinellae]
MKKIFIFLSLLAGIGCSSPKTVPVQSDFEALKPGKLREFADNSGKWKMLDDFIHPVNWSVASGKSALLFPSGKEKTLEFVPTTPQECYSLGFTARRLVNKGPFSVDVLCHDGKKWNTAGHVGDEMQTGFTDYIFPLTQRVEKVRFVVTTPSGSGVIIDDFFMLRNSPMQIDSVSVTHHQVPVLKGKATNNLGLITVYTQGVKEVRKMTELAIELTEPTRLEDIESMALYYSGVSARMDGAKLLASAPTPAKSLAFACDQELRHGKNHFWISAKLKNNADILHKIKVNVTSVKLDGDAFDFSENKKHQPQRLGIAIKQAGEDGVPIYRIPGLATTNKGTLIAVYDVRRDVIKNMSSDLPNPVDVGMQRSEDGGRTWSPMQVVMDMGNDDEEGAFGNGIGDPAILVDKTTGTIWVMATWSHGDNAWAGSGKGLTKKETGQLILVKSDDDGKTWSKPINITRQVKKPDWHYLLQGPGRGITMKDGTIVFAAQYQDGTKKRIPFSTIIYSKDHGKTWKIENGPLANTTEAQVVELEPGTLMLNMRDNRNRGEKGDKNGRAIFITKDLGKTWTEHPTSHGALKEPTCMASLHKQILGGREVLYFSNPDSKYSRDHITIKASKDFGKTWKKENQVLLDELRGAGYSCLTDVGEKYVGILYESSQAHLIYQLIPVSEILN